MPVFIVGILSAKVEIKSLKKLKLNKSSTHLGILGIFTYIRCHDKGQATPQLVW